jgi:hypothetical protein
LAKCTTRLWKYVDTLGSIMMCCFLDIEFSYSGYYILY